MTAFDYWNLLRRGHFQISPSRWHMALLTCTTSLFNSAFAVGQTLFFSSKLRRVNFEQPPVFIIGHFRTGTTMLYEYMSQDDQFVYPTTYQCFAPRHFLLTQKILPRLFQPLLPGRRPMDNMAAGFHHPQEDEFATLAMGAPTIYHRLAFPNQPPQGTNSLVWEDADSLAYQTWEKNLLQFYRAVSLGQRRSLLVKSPCHTGRIAVLRRIFPDAKFIHIVRDARSILPSILNAWRVLEVHQGFQFPSNEDRLEQFVEDTGRQMYHAFWNAEPNLPDHSICHVNYEQFIADPMRELARVYEELALENFAVAEPKFFAHREQLRSFQTNQFPQPQTPIPVDSVWHEYQHRYGYLN